MKGGNRFREDTFSELILVVSVFAPNRTLGLTYANTSLMESILAGQAARELLAP